MSTNGWGKGSVNNDISWGAGAINNDIGWGDSQLKSWSGDTDIDGGTGIPVNTVAPVISGATTLESILTTTNGTWIAKPAATYEYQWKRNGSNIVGARSQTYRLTNDDGATNITCQVIATNDFGSASAISNTLAIPAFTDADAQAFITAASITNPTQQSAINTLVTDLKGYGVWSKMKALYPFVGGTASSHKFNLKNPLDTDAAFRLVFNGGVTHSSNGVLFNGTNGWANTFVNPLNALTLNNTHCSLYSRTNNLVAGTDIGTAFNARTIGSVIKWTDNNGYHDMYNNTTNRIIYNMSGINSTGLFINNRTSNVVHNIWRNNTKLSTNSNIQSSILPNLNISIGALNSNFGVQYYTNRQYAFATIGDGLNDTEAANFYIAVQAFQTTLGRNV
jgi:ribosomal protein L18